MSPTVLPRRREHGLQGRHVLALFLAFFALVFVVNGAMIYAAVSTHSGLVAKEPYRKGLHYNERIAADVRQARLGWTDTVELGRDGRVVVALADVDGRPVAGLRTEALIGRPSTDRQDIRLGLREVEPGRYEGKTEPLGGGTWLVALEIRTDVTSADPVYRSRRRLWLEP